MKIYVYETYEKMSRAAAELIAAQLLVKPDSHIGLTAGKTPAGLFGALIDLYREGMVSYSRAWFYNLEEVTGHGPDSPESYRAVFQDLLLDHVGVDPSRMRLPNGLAENIPQECAEFEALQQGLPGGGLDMQVLGLGLDGHIGCNRPGDTLTASWHPVGLSRGRTGMAMGMGGILGAKCLLMLANGQEKAQAVADMCRGEISTRRPSTFLQLHPNTIVLLDREAASQLNG